MDEEYFLRKFDQYEHGRLWDKIYMEMGLESEKVAGQCNPPLAVKDSLQEENMERNRYRNVLPYDHNRVLLCDDDGARNSEGGASAATAGSNYINASHLYLPFSRRHYILSQGPLASTSTDFWRMVWESSSRVIVMLSKIVEKNFIKCHQYYPTSGDELLQFGDFECKLTDEESREHYVVRNIELRDVSSSTSSLRVKHFQFVNWPDFGVPDNTDYFLEFFESVRRADEEALAERRVLHNDNISSTTQFPIICHCSAGIGRSGAFVVVDAVISMLEKLKGVEHSSPLPQLPFNSPKIENELAEVETQLKSLEDLVAHLRKSRMGLIQTPQQLRFCWKAIVDWIGRVEAGNDKEPNSRPKASSELSDTNSAAPLATPNHRKRSSSDQRLGRSEELRIRREKVEKMRAKLADTERRLNSGFLYRLFPRLHRFQHSLTGSRFVVALCSIAVASLAIGAACYLAFYRSNEVTLPASDTGQKP